MNFRIIQAIEAGDFAAVKTYVNYDKMWKDEMIKKISFLSACQLGKVTIANYLKDFINPNCRYADGQTALMLIAQFNNSSSEFTDFFEAMIEKGCDVDLVDYCDKSALHWAALNNSCWAIRALISHRCNINSVDLLGFTPLMYAAKMNFAYAVSILIHSGADLTKSSKNHGCALHVAVRSGSLTCLDPLILFCRHLNILDSRNQTPVDIAVIQNNLEIVKLFISSGKEVELNRRPSFAPFRTPLEEACLKGNTEICGLLLNAGADPNHSLEFAFDVESIQQQNRASPVSPLMLAVVGGYVELVKLLLSFGADWSISCPKQPGYIVMATPLEVAIETKQNDIMKIIQSYRDVQILNNVTAIEWSNSLSKELYAALKCGNYEITQKLLTNIESIVTQDVYTALPNGLPILLLLMHEYEDLDMQIEGPVKQILDKLSPEVINSIMDIKTVRKLNGNSRGPYMHKYRLYWLRFAEYVLCSLPFARNDINNNNNNNDCDGSKMSEDKSDVFLEFVSNYLYYLFMKEKYSRDYYTIKKHIHMLETVFEFQIIRKAFHATKPIKSILLSQSPFALCCLVDYCINENMLFWDSVDPQPFDICELAVFFDNIDAALVLNLLCGASLKFVCDYANLSYVPDVMNESAVFNDNNKIQTLKTLSFMVKPLSTLCKYELRRAYIENNNNRLENQTSNPFLKLINVDFSKSIQTTDGTTTIIMYNDLYNWAHVDLY